MIMRNRRWLEDEIDEMNITKSEEFDDCEYDHYVKNLLFDMCEDEEHLIIGNTLILFHLTEISCEIYLFYF
jgi:hypothetical protein